MLDVDLYYYDNPGQEPAQMVNQYGESYSSLPNAFRFRTEFDTESKCQPVEDKGQVSIVTLADGSTRAMVDYLGATFPLPVRDPRNIQRIITAPTIVADAGATFVNIPLPRPRPAAPGETPVAVAVPLHPAADHPDRVVEFAGKRVRIVGPVTPYAQVAAKGS
jgi:hypothetical protein